MSEQKLKRCLSVGGVVEVKNERKIRPSFHFCVKQICKINENSFKCDKYLWPTKIENEV